MPRIPRLLNERESSVYHVMSRTALDGFPLGDVERDSLLEIIKRFGKLYFVDILGFSIMGNHFHLLVRMYPGSQYEDREIQRRVNQFYKGNKTIHLIETPKFRKKLGSLSELIKDIKQSFSRKYNKERGRRGFFWGERFKSVIVENGETLINCLAYIDLNPVRANIVERPEDYRWNTLGYLLQTKNKDGLLTLEFGLPNEGEMNLLRKVQSYRQFVYEIGVLPTNKGKSINQKHLETNQKKGFKISRIDNFKHRSRYFSDSGVIGSKKFVKENYTLFKNYFNTKREKTPIPIKGLNGLYSLKRLSSQTF